MRIMRKRVIMTISIMIIIVLIKIMIRIMFLIMIKERSLKDTDSILKYSHWKANNGVATMWTGMMIKMGRRIIIMMFTMIMMITMIIKDR